MDHNYRKNKKYGGSIDLLQGFIQYVPLVIQIEMILYEMIVGLSYSK
jgi:hypothetical protein